MAGKAFFDGRTKTAIRELVRNEIAANDFGVEFTSDLISRLIATHHYYCSVNGLRPTAFRKLMRSGGGYDFQGLFGEQWHLVSWTQCLEPRDDRDWLTRCLRDVAMPIVAAYKRKCSNCEVCGVNPSEEVDHVRPSFREIADAAIATLSQADIDAIIRSIDWWNEEAFRLPGDSPAVVSLIESHKTATLQAVCKRCHLTNARDRK